MHAVHVFCHFICCTLYSCNMGMSGLPDISTKSTKAAGPRAEGVSGKSQVPMLQLLRTYHLVIGQKPK